MCLFTVHVQWALDPHDTVWLLPDPSVSGLTMGVADCLRVWGSFREAAGWLSHKFCLPSPCSTCGFRKDSLLFLDMISESYGVLEMLKSEKSY